MTDCIVYLIMSVLKNLHYLPDEHLPGEPSKDLVCRAFEPNPPYLFICKKCHSLLSTCHVLMSMSHVYEYTGMYCALIVGTLSL